jgi:hypothetical protein
MNRLLAGRAGNDRGPGFLHFSGSLEAEQHHMACGALLDKPGMHIHAHALAETFSTLTGGRLGYRVLPETAMGLLEQSVLAYVEVITLSAKEMIWD